MDEKKIIYKSIDEQLAEEEAKERAAATSKQTAKSDAKSTGNAVARNSTGVKRGRKKLRLKKSARRTIGSLLLATSLVVGVIPVGGVSADSTSDTGYWGSNEPAKELDDIEDDTEFTSKDPDDYSGYIGGFPLLVDGSGNPEQKSYGDHSYYVVDKNGFTGEIRPIFSLGGSERNAIKYYFETNGGNNYIPQGNKINLVTGYTNENNLNNKRGWTDTDEAYLYIASIEKYSLKENDIRNEAGEVITPGGDYGGNPLYGKKIAKFQKIKTFTIEFYNDNADEDPRPVFRSMSNIPEGTDLLNDNDFKDQYSTIFNLLKDASVKGGSYEKDKGSYLKLMKDGGEFDPSQSIYSINADENNVIRVEAVYTYPTGGSGGTDGSDSGEPLESNNNEDQSSNGTDEQNTDESNMIDSGHDNNTSPTINPGQEDDKDIEDSNSMNESNSVDSPGLNSTDDERIIENHDIDEANESPAGLTGVLLDPVIYPVHYNGFDEYANYYLCNGIKFSKEEVTTDPEFPAYVCDAVAPVNIICNEVFKGTHNVHTVDLPEGILYLGISSFEESGVKNIVLGGGIKEVGSSAFKDCKNLEKVQYLAVDFVIGAKAFANTTSLQLFSDTTGYIIPSDVKRIGRAAFYGSNITGTLDFTKPAGCTVGDYAFARCKSLQKADLNNSHSLSIVNLDKSKTGVVSGLFAECSALTEAIMPSYFNGTLKEGTFGKCTQLNHIVFNSNEGTFSDKEFDKRKITVEGPKPSSLNPSGNAIKSFESSLKTEKDTAYAGTPYNDYVYRYYDDSTCHEVVNHIAYDQGGKSGYAFFKAKRTTDGKKEGFVYTQNYVFDINKSNNYISGQFYRGGTTKCNLEIGDDIGPRKEAFDGSSGPIKVSGIADKAFYQDNSIENLQLNNNIKYVGESAFEGKDDSGVVRLWANLSPAAGGTLFNTKAFYKDTLLKRVTFSGDGKTDNDHSSYIGELCFAEAHNLKNVDFYDDNIIDGNTDKFAWFAPNFTNSETGEVTNYIALNAFYDSSRNEGKNITFKGPIIEGYGPYEFAQNREAKVMSDEIYPLYYSGNPQNIVVQYKVAPPISKKIKVNSLGDTLPGVCLLYYPNMTTRIMKDDYNDFDKDGGTKLSDLTETSGMVTAAQKCTREMVIPYGIDYIDLAVSKINAGTSSEPNYYRWNEDWDSDVHQYNIVGGDEYTLFQYLPDLESITFSSKRAWEFPDKMFEGARTLKMVDFQDDVLSLGKTPFYLPDTQLYLNSSWIPQIPEPHDGAGTNLKTDGDKDKSHVVSVKFNEDGTKDPKNEYYYADKNGEFTGIIKGDNGTDVTVYQILPGRGDADLGQTSLFGNPDISADELSDVTKFVEYAARDCDEITSVSFPDNARVISTGCFMDCDKLSVVNMPKQTPNIGDKSFGYIQSDMKVYFNTLSAEFVDTPFAPAGKNGDKNPWVEFEAEKMPDGTESNIEIHAKNNKNIKYPITEKKKKVTITLQDVDSGYTRSKTYDINPAYAYDFWDELANKNPPDLPQRGGIYPTGWKDATGKISEKTPLSSDTTLYAQYDEQFTVRFLWPDDYPDDNKVITTCLVGKGGKIDDTVIAQVIAQVQNATYNGKVWDSTNKFNANVYQNITSNLDIKVVFKSNKWKVYFIDNSDGLILGTAFVDQNGKVASSDIPDVDMTGKQWKPSVNTTIDHDNYEILLVDKSTPSSSSSKDSSSSKTSSKSTSSKTTSSSNSSSNKSSSSSSSSSAYPVFVNSQEAGAGGAGAIAGVGSTVYLGDGSGGSGSGGSGSGGNKGSGNTTVVSTTGGISDPSKITATVNGSSDNYVIKITQTQEADEMGLAALHSAYGDDISAIRYLPFDISLYDSTGTNKISPVPEGISVSLTMPIPDDLAIYGGNAKIASTAGGQLDKIQPRFTVINGVPCMTYTCTHLSPYMIYVDTANLTEAGIADATPKTADGIHPKWFLCFGLAAIAIVLFLKKDPEEYIKKAAA